MKFGRRVYNKLYCPLSKFIHERWAFFFPSWYARYLCKKVTNKKLDLKDPREYNEKLQWMKIHTDTSEWTRLADKVKVRDYVTECGLGDHLPKIYGVWERADEIDFDSLPDTFVLKTNHGFENLIIVDDRSKLDIEEAKRYLNKWVKQRYGLLTFEPHYWNIERRILAEEYLMDEHNARLSTSLIDYKFYCVNGDPFIIMSLYNRQNVVAGKNAIKKPEREVMACVYDLEWNPRPDLTTGRFGDNPPGIIPRPKHLDQMIKICNVLAKPFPLLRVDLYEVNDKVYFSELTFTPGGGMAFYTKDVYLEMGRRVDLSKMKPRTKRWIV
jgi:hypothetical protein